MYIILIILAFGLFAGFWAFLLQRKGSPKKWSIALVLISAFSICLVILEVFLMGIDKFQQGSEYPEPPGFLISRDAASHMLLNNSILYIEPPNTEFRTVGHIYRTNRFGFRERNFLKKKPPNTFRILVFGDSFTFGTAVADEHRYTNQLEDMLNSLEDGTKYEVLNFGMPGYAVDQERDLIEAILNQVETDLVVLGVCCDDLNLTTKSSLDAYAASSTFEFVDENGKKIYSNNLRNYSTLPAKAPPNFFKSVSWYQKTKLFKFLAARSNLDRNRLIPSSKRWEYALHEYRSILLSVTKRGLPPPIALLLYFGSIRPSENDFIHPHDFISQYNRLYEFLGEKLGNEGFVIANPLKLFQEHSGMSLAVSEWEKHPNFVAHFLYAHTLLNLIGSPNQFKL